MRVYKKLKSNSGFTLIEMLCAALVLALLCVMFSAGLSLALQSYRHMISVDESELLVDSLVNAVSDKYRYAVVEEVYSDELGAYVFAEDVGQPGVDEDGYATIGGKKLLPDGAYSVRGSSGDVTRRYLVDTFTVERSTDAYGFPIFSVVLRVRETHGWGSQCEREFTVTCLTPARLA